MILEVHFEPNYRAVVVRATMSSEKVQLINVYLKSGGEPRELRVTLESTAPYLLDTEFFTIYGGDFQAKPGWDMSCPLASTVISTAILDTFADTSIQVVPKEQDMPTWFAPQGFYGALDHFLIPEPTKYNATVCVQSTSSFPPDHTPILLCIPQFTLVLPPSTLQHTGRILSPKVLSPIVQMRYQAAFDEFLFNRADTLEDECQNFSTAVLQAAQKIFGPPTNLATVPTVVQRAQTDMEPFVQQYPHWWKDTAHNHQYQNKKARIREAWDLVQLERKLQISLTHVHAANEANAPRKPLYRRIFRTGAQTGVEPMFVSGIPTPTELHGLIGMDQFRQRHLAPSLRMEAEHIQYYMQWSPLPVPDIGFTTQMIKHTLSNASHTTPYQDLLEYKFLRFLSDKQLERLAQIYNRWYGGKYLHKVFQEDFYALPNKIPHGPIANARPLLNFTTI